MSDEKKLDELTKIIVAHNEIAAVNIAVVTEKLDTAAEDRKLMRSDIKEIKKTVNGNGETGLVGRVGILENWHDVVIRVTWWVLGILATVIASTILYYLLRA